MANASSHRNLPWFCTIAIFKVVMVMMVVVVVHDWSWLIMIDHDWFILIIIFVIAMVITIFLLRRWQYALHPPFLFLPLAPNMPPYPAKVVNLGGNVRISFKESPSIPSLFFNFPIFPVASFLILIRTSISDDTCHMDPNFTAVL